MKIVNMEAHASNFDHLIPEDYFSCGGDLKSWEVTKQEQFVERAAGADAVLINKTRIGEAELAQLPDLKYIGVLATGYNVVDCEAARKRGIVVTNVPAYSTSSVAQMTFAHLLNLCRDVELHNQGDWPHAVDFCDCRTPQIELDGLTMGLYGFGAIARSVARTAQTFGMNVITCTRSPQKVDLPGVKAVSKEQLFRESDVVSLHCPQTPQTEKLISRETLSLMKPTAFLINTSRGGLVDEEALSEALRAHRIAGAGLDVLSVEPPPADHPLLHLPNCRITPHIAWASRAARIRLFECARRNIMSWLAGKPENKVN